MWFRYSRILPAKDETALHRIFHATKCVWSLGFRQSRSQLTLRTGWSFGRRPLMASPKVSLVGCGPSCSDNKVNEVARESLFSQLKKTERLTRAWTTPSRRCRAVKVWVRKATPRIFLCSIHVTVATANLVANVTSLNQGSSKLASSKATISCRLVSCSPSLAKSWYSLP